MKTYIGPNRQKKNSLNATKSANKIKASATEKFQDQRNESVAQRELQELVNNSSRVQSISGGTLQRMNDGGGAGGRGGRGRGRGRGGIGRGRGGGAAPPNPRQVRINRVLYRMTGPPFAHPAAHGPGLLAFHPRTAEEPWDYTRTVQFTVDVPGQNDVIVRAHIHYDVPAGGSGPGRMWISGTVGWSQAAPDWVVALHPAIPGAEDRQAAVDHFNGQHGTHHAVV